MTNSVLLNSAQGEVLLRSGEKTSPWNGFLSTLDSNPQMSNQEAMDRFAKTLSVAGSDWKDSNDNTLLMHVAFRGRLGIVKRLIHELYANVNATNKDGTTALHMAARSGYKDVCEELLDSNADATKKDQNGLTASMIASEAGYKEISDLIGKKETASYIFRSATPYSR